MSIEMQRTEAGRRRDGRVGLDRESACSWEDIQEAVLGVLAGDLTPAQLEGISTQQLYAAADLGYTLVEEGKLDGARSIFAGLSAYNPRDPYFHAMLGSIAQREKKFDEAMTRYRAATRLGPGEVSSWANQGEVMIVRSSQLQAEGEAERASVLFGEAVEALRRAIQLDPEGKTGSGRRARLLTATAAAICANAVGVAGA